MSRSVPFRRSPRSNRRGVAATEFAVCLPVLLLLVLGTIEACSMIFLQQSLTVGSYEAARTAIEEGADLADVQSTGQAVLRDRRVQGGTVTVSPANFTALSPGEYLTVTTTAPADRNAILPGSFYRGRVLSATATMMKEF